MGDKKPLFKIKNRKTDIIYDNNRWGVSELIEDMGLSLFRPFQFLIDDEGQLIANSTLDELLYVPMDDLKVVWNFEHALFKKEERTKPPEPDESIRRIQQY